MNILVLTINYSPEPTGFAPHITALSKHLVEQGHKVTVFTGFPFAPFWKRYPTYKGKIISIENLDGVEVFRLSHFIPRKPRKLASRLFLEISYCLVAFFVFLWKFRSNWDLVFYIGAQPSISMLARVISFLKKIPYVVEITDLAALAAEDLGIIKNRLLSRLFKLFEYTAYSAAEGAIVLFSGYKDILVANGFEPNRIRIIYSPVDLKNISPLAKGSEFRSYNHIKDTDFVILHAGSMGIKQGLRNVIDSALILRDDFPMVKWILVGDGEERPYLLKKIKEFSLQNKVVILPFQPEKTMGSMYASADVLLLNQVRAQDKIIASKFLAYMAAGKAVLAAVNPNSPAAILLKQAGGGIIVDPENSTSLANAVIELLSNQMELKKMGKLNRLYAELHFDQFKILNYQVKFFNEVVHGIRTK